MNYTEKEFLLIDRLLAPCCKVIYTHTHSTVTGKDNGQLLLLLFLGIIILTVICDKAEVIEK